jgi:hypothetical protein
MPAMETAMMTPTSENPASRERESMSSSRGGSARAGASSPLKVCSVGRGKT